MPKPPERAEWEHMLFGSHATTTECQKIRAAVQRALKMREDAANAGIEMEHIQNTGETFPMTIKRLEAEIQGHPRALDKREAATYQSVMYMSCREIVWRGNAAEARARKP